MTGRITPDDWPQALAAATGDESLLSTGINAATRLEGDLRLDSLDLAALSALLRDRYGSAVDLIGYVAGLDIDEIIGLTVADVTDYVNRACPTGRTAERRRSSPGEPVPDRDAAADRARVSRRGRRGRAQRARP